MCVEVTHFGATFDYLALSISKGSIFVEFNSADEANQFLNLEPKPTYEGRELLIMTKNGYTDMKCKELGIVPDYSALSTSKGSVFVEFNSADEANQFLNLEPKPTYEGRELLIMTKNGYTDMNAAKDIVNL